eukprot:TRINITY_DN37617_c0_g1_i1.p1 TRINITY_DN37617_c0_g1~~TRINITY_DN37617_c0_g1_i1.p1  ORF type:complete len:942 (-),score=259.75 TRINITY_DN37617_c0_g1_i1:225-2999(-)
MAELPEIKDVSSSVAFHILEDLHKDGSISKAEMDLYKSKYAKLHGFVQQTYEAEQDYLQRAKQLGQKLMSEKIKLEKTTQDSQEDQTCIEQLQSQVSEISAEYEIVQDREMMLQLQLSELQHEKREKEAMLEQKERERQADMEPKIQKARDENENTQKEIEHMRGQKEACQKQLLAYEARTNQLLKEIEDNGEIHTGHEQEYNKIKGDPERIRKQAEKFESAVRALSEQQREKKAEIEMSNEVTKKNEKRQKDADDQRSNAHLRLQMITQSSLITDQSCEEVKKRLDREKNIYKELMSRRVQLDTEIDEMNSESRLAMGELSQLQKTFDKLKRQYRKTQMAKDGVDESLGPLKVQQKDNVKQSKQQQEELTRQKKLLEDIQGEVDLFIGAYLKQESLEKDKKEEYESINTQMDDMQKELRNLKAEEQHWNAHFKTLASQREKLARKASTAHRLCRETADEVSMKQHEEDDLKKKHQETSLKQKEFCALYEVVKNERNKTMTNIQEASQHLSEMKEKLKILQNELEILKMESQFKDKKLASTKTDLQRLEAIHDQLQNEKTKITAKGAALNEQVEQYVIEMDKLNSIISSIEKEMFILRKKYEQAVETRNFTGTQLIDRNDELCILWEKANIQEKLLKKGEDAMLQKSEEIRGLNIDRQEVRRQLLVVQKKIPEVPKLVEEVARLREQVASVRKRSDELSRELEIPNSTLRRWRKLGGEDLDENSLRKKIQDLEERLNDKKETLLEKELILEEVTALSEKLRQQAVDGRQGTMELSQKVNIFQARIKEVTRKMMATVSELSMYQAMAHKLQGERDEACDKSMQARELFREGNPPTDTADAEFEKMLQVQTQKASDAQAAATRRQEEEIMNSNFTRTTAEPRHREYIPEDDRGLPKAYGGHGQFKPTVGGTTMRHIRKPNPKPIEL